MQTFNVSVKVDQDGFKTFSVDKEVYNYIRQLENAVKYPHAKAALLSMYPSRFDYLKQLHN